MSSAALDNSKGRITLQLMKQTKQTTFYLTRPTVLPSEVQRNPGSHQAVEVAPGHGLASLQGMALLLATQAFFLAMLTKLL